MCLIVMVVDEGRQTEKSTRLCGISSTVTCCQSLNGLAQKKKWYHLTVAASSLLLTTTANASNQKLPKRLGCRYVFLNISYLFYFTNDTFRYYLQQQIEQRDDRMTSGKETTGRQGQRKGREEMRTTAAQEAPVFQSQVFFFLSFFSTNDCLEHLRKMPLPPSSLPTKSSAFKIPRILD